jgi:cytochrome b
LHWVQAVVLALAWWTGSLIGPWHEYLGYIAAALLAARILWGMAGSRHARFAGFVRVPRVTWRYVRSAVRGHAPRYVGHNPAGGWMILWLLACVGAVVVTGWLYTTDWLWGYGWLAYLHAALAWVLVGSVALHVLGVLATSWQQRENLVAAMFSGRKRPPDGDDVA